MNEQEKRDLETLRQRYPRNIWAPIELNSVVVLMRGELEIEFFHCEKDAGAWMQHVYGCTPWGGRSEGVTHHEHKCGDTNIEWQPVSEKLTIKPIKDRGPKAGDLLLHLDDGGYYHHGLGILDHSYGKEELSVCFGASAYRVGASLSCSGGPIPPVKPEDLIYDGLRECFYWRWWDGFAGGHQGGKYSMLVPSWRWDVDA